MKTRKFLLEVSSELLTAIDAARGDSPRCPWIEQELWKLKSVKDAAAKAGVSNPKRPIERRGSFKRKRKVKR